MNACVPMAVSADGSNTSSTPEHAKALSGNPGDLGVREVDPFQPVAVVEQVRCKLLQGGREYDFLYAGVEEGHFADRGQSLVHHDSGDLPVLHKGFRCNGCYVWGEGVISLYPLYISVSTPSCTRMGAMLTVKVA